MVSPYLSKEDIEYLNKKFGGTRAQHDERGIVEIVAKHKWGHWMLVLSDGGGWNTTEEHLSPIPKEPMKDVISGKLFTGGMIPSYGLSGDVEAPGIVSTFSKYIGKRVKITIEEEKQ